MTRKTTTIHDENVDRIVNVLWFIWSALVLIGFALIFGLIR
jgi:hypothetical protein